MLGILWRTVRLLFKYRLIPVLVDLTGNSKFNRLNMLAPLVMASPCVSADSSRGERIRRALLEMGTIYVKLGQALSVRKDFIALDICDQLALLRDDCPPFDSALSRQIIEQQLGSKIEELFIEFDDKPIASATIAQVHFAKLKNAPYTNQGVVIKVVRPDIDQRIADSIYSMETIAKWLHRFVKEARPLKPIQVIQEFVNILTHEKDMHREAANASLIRAHFENDSAIYIPKVYWEYTADRVMVMERIYGTPVHEVEKIRDMGVDLKQLAENGVRIFFKQVFEYNLFHADMHPGNVFVSPEGQYRSVDYGIVGSLSEQDKLYLAQNFIAFFDRNYRQVAELHIHSGWVKRNTRVEELEAAVRTVAEPIYGKNIGDISFGSFLLQLFKVAKSFGMEVQPQLVLLQKTLFNIEGLGRQLYPQLDLWQTARPFLENWMKQQFSPKLLLQDAKVKLPLLRTQLLGLSGLSTGAPEEIQTLTTPKPKSSGLSRLDLVGGLLLLLGAILLFSDSAFYQQWLSGQELNFSLVFFIVGFILLLIPHRNS